MEIWLNEYRIEFIKSGFHFKLPGFDLVYKGPILKWHCFLGSFRINSMKMHFTLFKLSKLSNIYKKYLLIKEFEILDIDIKDTITKIMIDY